MENKSDNTGPMNDTPAKAALLDKWREAKGRQWELLQRHDESGTVEFRNEPWYPEYATASNAMSVLFALGAGLGIAEKYPAWVDAGPDGYPWVLWEQRAIAAGVDPNIADAGKDIYEFSLINFWVPELKSECGWDDNGEAMIVAALDNPDATHTRWNLLVSSDGLKDTLGDVSPGFS